MIELRLSLFLQFVIFFNGTEPNSPSKLRIRKIEDRTRGDNDAANRNHVRLYQLLSRIWTEYSDVQRTNILRSSINVRIPCQSKIRIARQKRYRREESKAVGFSKMYETYRRKNAFPIDCTVGSIQCRPSKIRCMFSYRRKGYSKTDNT